MRYNCGVKQIGLYNAYAMKCDIETSKINTEKYDYDGRV